MHGLALIYVIRDLPGIESFKIVQETVERTCVEIVAGNGYGPQVEARIVDGMKARLGAAVEVRIELRSELPKDPSGKFRYVRSMVSA